MENNFSVTSLINNIAINLARPSNNHRYSDHAYQCAIALFLYDDQNAYCMVSLNFPGLLSSKETIRQVVERTSFHLNETEFSFDEMLKYLTILDTRCAFCPEEDGSRLDLKSAHIKMNRFPAGNDANL